MAAVSTDGSTFSQYVLPCRPISKEAADITKLTMCDGDLYHEGVKVAAIPIKQCLSQFIDWLKQYKNPVLVAHNGLYFDSKVITTTLKNTNMLDRFRAVVIGFADTLLYFRGEFPGFKSYRQEALVKHFISEEYGAHDATEDVKMLQKLTGDKPETKLQPYSFSTDYIVKYLEFFRQMKQNLFSLKPLIDSGAITKAQADKLALSNYCYGSLFVTD